MIMRKLLLHNEMLLFWLLIAFHVLVYLVKADVIAIDSHNDTETFPDRELRFRGDILGAVVLSEPIDACFNISAPPPHLINAAVNCFVLIEGSTCGLVDKVKHAVAANYSAVLIYNYRDLVLPFHIPFYYDITVVLINGSVGERIIEHYLYSLDPGSRILIFSNQLNIMAILLLFAIVAGIFILLVLIFLMIKCIQQSRRRNRCRLSSRHLKQLETLKYKTGDPYDTCAICLEDYKEKDRLRVLPCSHAYHCKCIDPWLTNNKRTCPVCKQKVRLAGVHDDETDSESDTESRAETAPLIRGARRYAEHGTFSDRMRVPLFGGQSTSSGIRIGSGETTSRDVPSDALDETPDEDNIVFRSCMSAPDVLIHASNHSLLVPDDPETPKEQAEPLVVVAVTGDNNTTDNSHSSSSSCATNIEKQKTYVV